MDLLEHLGVQFLELAQRLQRIEQPCVRPVHLTHMIGMRTNSTYAGLSLRQLSMLRVEYVAVRAGVPEELDDLDLARRRVGRLCRRQHLVVGAGDPLVAGSCPSGGNAATRSSATSLLSAPLPVSALSCWVFAATATSLTLAAAAAAVPAAAATLGAPADEPAPLEAAGAGL